MRMYYFIVVVLQLAHPRSRTRGVPMVKINVLNRARVVLLVLPRFLATLAYLLAVGVGKLPKSDVPNGCEPKLAVSNGCSGPSPQFVATVAAR